MKSSLIVLLFCSLLIMGAQSDQCSPAISQCLQCNNNATTTCTQCINGYKPNKNKQQCIECSNPNCASCYSEPNVCNECESDFSSFKLVASSQALTCIACHISGQCSECQNPQFCKQCKAGAIKTLVDPSGRRCIKCTDTNCIHCHEEDKCRLCINGFVSSSSGKCNKCKVDNCMTCSAENVCQKCLEGFSVDSTGKNCIVCKYPCLSCNDDGSCKDCYFPFYNSVPSQANGKCFKQTVKNCKSASTTDNAKCQTCADFFKYDSASDSCILKCQGNCLTCSTDPKVCLSCPLNYYLQSSACVLCPIGRTRRNSTSTSCDLPQIGYYKENSQFKKCPAFCQSCQSSSICDQLINKNGRVLLFNVKDSGNKLAKCAGNCRQCSAGNSEYCITCHDGHFLENGICKKCGPACKTCSSTTTTTCLSCYYGAFLSSDNCISCDSNCLTCKSSTQLAKCTSCKDGWSLNAGTQVCEKSCPANCLKCDSSTNCLKCSVGYTTFLNSGSDYMCLPCIQNCRTCMQGQPNICLQCGDGFWTLNGEICRALQMVYCKRGNNQQCFQCIQGYQLVDSLTCQPKCEYPCATCSSSNPNSCSSCIAGYIFQANSKQCKLVSDCKNGCNACPFGYSLSYGNCIQCPQALTNCQRCDLAAQKCTSCLAGFYLSEASACTACPAECKQCYSDKKCSQCKPGYFLQAKSDTCEACSSAAGCATCANQAGFCLTCSSGYTLNGWRCSKANGLKVVLTVSKQISLFNSNYYNKLILFFLGLVGSTDPNDFTLKGLSAIDSSTTEITFLLAFNFAFSQTTGDQKLKAVHDAVYTFQTIILTDLTVITLKASLSGEYKSTLKDNFCLSLIQGCLRCTYGTNKCLGCKDSLTVITHPDIDQCISCNVKDCQNCYVKPDVCDICDPKFYLDTTVSPPACKSCTDSNCEICSAKDTCTKCATGYITDQKNACIKCTLQNCLDCESSTFCKTCSDGFALDYSTGKCFKCSISNCNKCLNEKVCSQCDSANGWTLNQATGLCQKCAIDNCLTCYNTQYCAQCKTNYHLNTKSGLCISCNVANCKNGCLKPDVCSDTALCAATDFVAVSPIDQSKLICIACDIKDCIECIWDNFCYTCNQTTVKTLSPDVSGQKCISCNVTDCALCSSPDVCAFCLFPKKLNEENKCIFCNVDNCLSCSKVGFCQNCVDGYTVTTAGKCAQCPSQCLTCLPNGQCINCAQPAYNLLPSQKDDDSGKCFLKTIPNCLSHNRADHTKCQRCIQSYDLSQDKTECSNACNLICKTCSKTKPSQCLSCRDGFYLDETEKTCKACSRGCLTCTKSGCTKIKLGFFLKASGQVGSCQKNCKVCTSQKYCTELQDDEGKSIVKGQSGQTFIVFCASNCKKCQTSQSCNECKDGFYLKKNKQKDRSGICYQCDSSCKTCDRKDPTICLSCPENSYFKEQKCISCDENCRTCKSSTQLTTCTTCINGRWLDKSSNKCMEGCPDNCLACSSATDCSICNTGYTVVKDAVQGSDTIGQLVCTPCLASCRVCAKGEPSTCIDCGDGFYQLKGECTACQDNCKTCTQNQCTACFDTYDLVLKTGSTTEKVCTPSCTFPCLECNIGKPTECTSCFGGYSLSGTECTALAKCTKSSGCAVCPSGYVLADGVCKACTTSKCQKCLSDNPDQCLTCGLGYYLSSKTCTACPASCKSCYSAQQCVSCTDGYVLQNRRRRRGYRCIACAGKCKTCVNNQNKCTSCVSGFQLRGWKCEQVFRAQMTHVFNVPTIARFNLRCRHVLFAILKILGLRNPTYFTFISVRTGSVILQSSAQLQGGVGSSQASNGAAALAQAAGGSQLGGLPLISAQSSVTVVGGNLSSSSNLGIILGICIPIGVLILLGIIMFVVYKAKNVEKQKFEEGYMSDRDNAADSKAKMEYDDNSLI